MNRQTDGGCCGGAAGDLATISGLEGEAIHQRPERVVADEVLNYRVIDGMNYFRLAEGRGAEKVRKKIREKLDRDVRQADEGRGDFK